MISFPFAVETERCCTPPVQVGLGGLQHMQWMDLYLESVVVLRTTYAYSAGAWTVDSGGGETIQAFTPHLFHSFHRKNRLLDLLEAESCLLQAVKASGG